LIFGHWSFDAFKILHRSITSQFTPPSSFYYAQAMPNGIIDHIRERSAEGNFELPPLLSEPSRFKSIWELLLDLLEPILAPLFDGAGLAIELIPLGVILKYGVPIVLLLVIVYLAFVIYRSFSKRTPSVVPAAEYLDNTKTSGFNLEEQILHALSASDYGLALRLRWRAFLKRQGVSIAITPREYSTLQQISPALISRLYAGMFSGGAATRMLFEELDGSLSSQNILEQTGVSREG